MSEETLKVECLKRIPGPSRMVSLIQTSKINFLKAMKPKEKEIVDLRLYGELLTVLVSSFR